MHNAFKQKVKALNDITKKYELLKSEKMAAQTMNAASDEAEQMLQNMHGNRFLDQYNSLSGNGLRRPLSGSSNGPRDAVNGLHSTRRHPQQGRIQSRIHTARKYCC